MLVRLIYASRAKASLGSQDLQGILEQCKAHNPAEGITGMLCHSEGTFLQVLEGGRTEVNRVYARIVADGRHEQIELIDFEEIGQRRFANWSMGLVNVDRVNRALLLRYGAHARLDPYTMPASATLALLTELAESASVVCAP